MKENVTTENSERSVYLLQNKIIHLARAQLCMELDDCRELAREISGKPSISSLSLKQRSQLIDLLKSKGADVYNPSLPKNDPKREDIYPSRLEFWSKRFPVKRPGYASNKQLALIDSLWINYFNDGRAGAWINGLRAFIWRQTQNLEEGPVSDPAFLKSHHISSVMTPLKEKKNQKGGNHESKKERTKE